jgi:hypothetical protein
MTYTDYANVIEKGSVPPSPKGVLDTHARGAAVGKPVRFVTGASAGMEVRSTGSIISSIIVYTREFIQEIDQMVCIHAVLSNPISRRMQYEFQSESGLYPHTSIPDPRLERLGVKFHSNETLAEEELKKRYT